MLMFALQNFIQCHAMKNTLQNRLTLRWKKSQRAFFSSPCSHSLQASSIQMSSQVIDIDKQPPSKGYKIWIYAILDLQGNF